MYICKFQLLLGKRKTDFPTFDLQQITIIDILYFIDVKLIIKLPNLSLSMILIFDYCKKSVSSIVNLSKVDLTT